MAANKGEERILIQVPQLLRLEDVVDSAKMVLSLLKLPPALLRQEPLLLAMEPERLQGGFERLREELGADDAFIRESCRDAPSLLLEAAKNWANPKLTR